MITSPIAGFVTPEANSAVAFIAFAANKNCSATGYLGRVLTGAGLALLPWLGYLAATLPPAQAAGWVALDALEAAALLTAGHRLLSGDPRYRAPAAAAAVLLLADACIDLATAGPELATAVAMLAAIADGQAIRFVNQQAAALRHGMNEILAREKVAWKIYGEHSDWKIFFGADAPPRGGSDQSVSDVDWRRLDAKNAEQSRALRQALILNGVDFNGGRALVGTCHTDEIIAETLAAFGAAVRAMKEEGLV